MKEQTIPAPIVGASVIVLVLIIVFVFFRANPAQSSGVVSHEAIQAKQNAERNDSQAILNPNRDYSKPNDH